MTADALTTPWRYWLLAACLCWLALVVAPPVLVRAESPYGELVRWLLHPVCHQIADRSFHWLDEPLSVCARCTGLYLGFTLGVLTWPWLSKLARRLAAHPRWVLAFMVPSAVDVFAPNTGISRFVTGLIAAFPCALLALLVIMEWSTTNLGKRTIET